MNVQIAYCAIFLVQLVLVNSDNLALNKPADQTGTYGDLVASRAVDGMYGVPNNQSYCAHPENQQQGNDDQRLPARWWVDLLDTYLVDNVTVFNTYDSYGADRLEMFEFHVGLTLDNLTRCGDTHTSRVPPGGNVTVLCNIRGRYVQFSRVGGFQPSLVTLCEVEVYGRREIGTTTTDITTVVSAGMTSIASSATTATADVTVPITKTVVSTPTPATLTTVISPTSVTITNTTTKANTSQTDATKLNTVESTELNTAITPEETTATTTSTVSPSTTTTTTKNTVTVPTTTTTRAATTVTLTTVASTNPTITTAGLTSVGKTASTTKTSTDATTDADLVVGEEPDIIPIVIPIVVIILLVIIVVIIIILVRKGKIPFSKKKARLGIDDIKVQHTGEGFQTTPKTSPTMKKNNPILTTDPSEPAKPSVTIRPPAPPRPAFIRPSPVDVDELDDYVNKRKANLTALGEEYKSLPPEDASKHSLALTKENKPKNRFANIYAYDENRVILDEEEEGQGDYINANYITGCNGPKEYIATQGARSHTVVDLWRMIWQHGSNRIVMVANLRESNKERCAQYWPKKQGSQIQEGDFTITTEAEESCADYTTRIFTLRKGGESRTIRQFHFTSWEDKNKPLHGPVTLFAFYNKVRSFDRMSKGPMIVHCSAGVGRTGTFIAFDILLNQAAKEGKVDIYGCVEKLRGQRMLMVQTKEQYVFLHVALAEYLNCGRTSYPCNNFAETFDKINTPSDELGGISEIDRQFNLLVALKTQPSVQNPSGSLDPNKAKNRDMGIIPDDDSRPYLFTRYKAGNNYINAVFVPSFKEHGFYIATQMPLPNTMIDFWRLVHDMDCHSIVMLNTLDKGDPTCLPYWPDEDEAKQRYGPLEVELLQINADNTSKGIITRDFRVILASEKRNLDVENGDNKGLTVRQFQLSDWPKDANQPIKRGDILDLLDQLQRWQQQREKSPGVADRTIVHCMNGVDRCGVFCASSHTLDKMKIDQEVDAFLAVRYVARKRPQFVINKEQYTFLYQMAMECMSRYDEYANFQ